MSYKILIIEDEKRIRDSIVEFLEMHNYEVLEAENGEVGIRVAFAEKPHLIFCDMMMPVIDGMGVLKAINSSEIALGSKGNPKLSPGRNLPSNQNISAITKEIIADLPRFLKVIPTTSF